MVQVDLIEHQKPDLKLRSAALFSGLDLAWLGLFKVYFFVLS